MDERSDTKVKIQADLVSRRGTMHYIVQYLTRSVGCIIHVEALITCYLTSKVGDIAKEQALMVAL
jgi:hypothetical protein